MREPDEKQIELLLKSVQTDVEDYPNYRRGGIWAFSAGLVGFVPALLIILLLGKSQVWYLALVTGGVLAMIFGVIGAFRPQK